MNKYCLLLALALPGMGWASEPIQAVEAAKVKDPAKVELGKMQGEIVNILLKIKNSFLPTKQILIGL